MSATPPHLLSMVLTASALLAAAQPASATPLPRGVTPTALVDAPASVTATADTLPDRCPAHAEGRVIQALRDQGLTATRPLVVQRARLHRVGQRFRCARYRAEQTRLQGLDLFSAIRVTATLVPTARPPGLQGGARGRRSAGVALTYRFVELPPYLVFPAVRRSDLYGWLVGPAVSFLNFLGRDVRLDAYLRTAVSPEPFVATELLLEASSPWIGDDIPVEYNLTVLRNQSFNAVKQYHDTSWTGGLSLFHRLTWKLRLVYAGEFAQISPDPAQPAFTLASNPAPVPVLLNPEGDLVFGLAAGVLWDGRDRRVNPHSGLRLEARVGQYGGPLGGPADYRLLLLDLRGWWGVRWSASQLTLLHVSGLLRARPGRMGVYDYFVAGGPNSLRSYSQSAELHAQSEALGTVELRHELFDRRPTTLLGFHLYVGLQLVAGADVALLWRPQDSLRGAPRMHSSAYGGVHVLLPGVDRLRVEFGAHRDAALRWRPGFSVGLFEKSRTQRLRQR